jgi:hypothetical protein
VRRFGSDVTPLNCDLQFKPFVYLNLRARQSPSSEKESPASRRGLSTERFNPQLAALIGVLALTARILLLLARLLPAASLLLAGLLTRVRDLLTRILARIAHSGTPLFGFHGETTNLGDIGCGNGAVPVRSLGGNRLTGP